MSDLRTKPKTVHGKKLRPKPIRATPPPKIEVPFTNPHYNIADIDSSDEEDNFTLEPDKIEVDESPPPLPPTPPAKLDDEKPSGSKNDFDFPAQDANIDLESESSSEYSSTTQTGKVVYRLSSNNYRPVGWGFIKISVVGLCVSALIGIVFTLLSTKHTFELKTEMLNYPSENDLVSLQRFIEIVDSNTNETVCVENPPPISSCMVSDWDNKTRDIGTVVIYQCSNITQSFAMIVTCDHATSNWTVIKNNTNICLCENVDIR